MKVVIVMSILFVVISGTVVFLDMTRSKDVSDFDKTKADVLEIENIKITNISNSASNKEVTTKIKNKLDKTISNINIEYDELDQKDNKIYSNNVSVDVSLNKDEKAVVSIVPQSYTNTIDIVGYKYNTEDYNVYVDLNDSNIKVVSLDENKRNEEKHDILSLSELEKIDDTNYLLKVKNLSNKNLGNIILKVAELNSEKEYVNVVNVPYNNILKEKEEIELRLSAGENTTLEVIGYTYDDMNEKLSVAVDLKSNNSEIVKN